MAQTVSSSEVDAPMAGPFGLARAIRIPERRAVPYVWGRCENMTPQLPRLTFASGILSLAHAFRFLASHRAARRLAYVPGWIALCVWLGVLYAGVHYLPVLLEHMFPDFARVGSGWMVVFDALLVLLMAPLSLLFAMVVTPVVCAPLMERLVLMRERALGIDPRPAAGFGWELRCALSSQVGSLLLFGPIVVVLWLSSFLAPPAAPVLSVVQFLVSAAWLALSLLDYPLSLRGVRFRARLLMFRRGMIAVIGFGAGCALLFAIPLFGVWGLPVAVVAAAELAPLLEA